MNRQALLIASLLLNVALIVAVGWLIQPETAVWDSTPGDSDQTGAARSLSQLTGEVSPTIPARRSGANSLAKNMPDALGVTPPQGGSAVNQPIATNARREEVVIQAAVSGVSSLTNRGDASLEFDPQRFRTDRNSTAIAFSGGRGPEQSATGALRDSISPTNPVATANQGKDPTPSPVKTVDSVKLANGTDPSNREEVRRWPTGPFTPEEQAYRQQYGWEAFAEALRQRELEETGK